MPPTLGESTARTEGWQPLEARRAEVYGRHPRKPHDHERAEPHARAEQATETTEPTWVTWIPSVPSVPSVANPMAGHLAHPRSAKPHPSQRCQRNKSHLKKKQQKHLNSLLLRCMIILSRLRRRRTVCRIIPAFRVLPYRVASKEQSLHTRGLAMRIGLDTVSSSQREMLSTFKRPLPTGLLGTLFLQLIGNNDILSGQEMIHPNWVELFALHEETLREYLPPNLFKSIEEFFAEVTRYSEGLSELDPSKLSMAFSGGRSIKTRSVRHSHCQRTAATVARTGKKTGS